MRTTTILMTATTLGLLALTLEPALAQYQQQNLAGYQPGMGRFLDPELNGWGMVNYGVGRTPDLAASYKTTLRQ